MSNKPKEPTYTGDEVLAMMLNFATYVRGTYGLFSRQLADGQGRPVVLTPEPLALVEGWQVSLEQQVADEPLIQ